MSVEATADRTQSLPDARSNLRAVLVVLVAFCAFSATDALVKLLAQRFAVPQVTFMVTAAALALIVAQAGLTRNANVLRPRYPGLALLRALLLAADTLLIHYAFATLPLAEAYLLAFLTPVMVAILAFALLGERLSTLAWSGVLIGFLGVAVALRPGVAPLNLGHAAAVGSALLFALSLVLLRRARTDESDSALVATLLAMLTMIALAIALINGGLAPVSGRDVALACLAGALMFVGHMLLVRAFRIGDASIVAPFQYSQIIWGMVYGAVLFAAPVELHTLAGATIIILSGWLVLK
ncbi:DMT family transporter [Rhizobium sp. 32-5/1]|uniref:DMT family transporter n=1 Tax=Rhizobium sp. 32-5/1 TaxID=3019602 RepID=UPI00240E017D|nr:DMT family transporter [Rhizobium sp. 32-5/1]WEZ82119.1 DMT family transporter [Rhizobium sp. 32-5/1]